MALSIFGDFVNQGDAEIYRPPFQQIEYETQFDSTTLDRLRVLQAAKERAIKFEDFAEAKKIKVKQINKNF